MKRMILISSLFIFVSCKSPESVVIPEYNHDREHSKAYVRAVKKLSDHDRAMLNGYIGTCEMYRDPIGGATIGQAIEIMEKMNYVR